MFTLLSLILSSSTLLAAQEGCPVLAGRFICSTEKTINIAQERQEDGSMAYLFPRKQGDRERLLIADGAKHFPEGNVGYQASCQDDTLLIRVITKEDVLIQTYKMSYEHSTGKLSSVMKRFDETGQTVEQEKHTCTFR